MLWLPKRYNSVCFGSEEGTLVCVPRGHYGTFRSKEGSTTHTLVLEMAFGVIDPRGLFWLPRGHLTTSFGSQKSTLAHVLAPKRTLWTTFWLLRGHFSGYNP